MICASSPPPGHRSVLRCSAISGFVSILYCVVVAIVDRFCIAILVVVFAAVCRRLPSPGRCASSSSVAGVLVDAGVVADAGGFTGTLAAGLLTGTGADWDWVLTQQLTGC
ncbi:hypothetical protein Salat_1369400 [Sesamum alatum]|uniref:Uncharacterized protein n=1 Tax=Sesamum alatum TaxID=300844 RepID=A0AAE1Y964_9LAMI|nr:hypothetical protein Salat_1369400 [Sesamum alatum]